ncbi:4'-phosphopantetheinyl transferase superfamily protein [Betaproteobacteria bacterium PRO7]|jgi:phosphopantetheinyl transferase|nr:4'-phosphopantetheinyl transferase superfamily protein [Betaproteobacteria bacterium PRO7]
MGFAGRRISTGALSLDWLDGACLEVSHRLDPGVLILRFDVPVDVAVPPSLLDSRDLQRAARMHDRLEALRLLASHAALRSILSAVYGYPDTQMEFVIDDRGKPRLAGDRARFSISRSGAAVLIGVSESRDIGVDIERVGNVPELGHMARTHLSDREYQAWRCGDAATADIRFLRFWTRKEACVKAAGIGLALPLRRVDVRCDLDHNPCFVDLRCGPHAWTAQVVSLPMPSGVVAAAAVIA